MEIVKVEKAFIVDNDDKANWAMRKLRNINKAIRDVENMAVKDMKPLLEEVERIEAWKKESISAFDNNIQYFTGLLENYYRNMKELDPDYKLNTPNGKISSRKQQPKFKVDDDTLLKWLKERDLKSYIRVSEKPLWGELKKSTNTVNGCVTTEHGEIIEGVEVEERDYKINISLEDI